MLFITQILDDLNIVPKKTAVLIKNPPAGKTKPGGHLQMDLLQKSLLIKDL